MNKRSPSNEEDVEKRMFKLRTTDGKWHTIKIRIDVRKLAMSMAANAIRSNKKTSRARYGIIVVTAKEDETQ